MFLLSFFFIQFFDICGIYGDIKSLNRESCRDIFLKNKKKQIDNLYPLFHFDKINSPGFLH